MRQVDRDVLPLRVALEHAFEGELTADAAFISTCLLMASSSAHHEGRGRRAAGQRGGVMSESLGLTSHKSSCNCTGCGLRRAGVCINCAEKIAALILQSGPEELAVEPCSGACREHDPQPQGHMASHIGRRKFLATLGGAAVWPLAARAAASDAG